MLTIKNKDSQQEDIKNNPLEEINYIDHSFLLILKTHYKLFTQKYSEIKNKCIIQTTKPIDISVIELRPDQEAALKTISPICLNVIPPAIFEVSLDPDYAFYHYLVGNSLFHQGNFHKASYAFQTTAILEPESHVYRYNLGCTYMKIFDFQRAQNEFNKAITLGGNIPDYYYNMGIAYYCLDQLSDAINAIEKALSLDSNNEKFRSNLEKVKAMRVFRFWTKFAKDWSNWESSYGNGNKE
ncbi:MAG TPA: tetratricopeptide repeat protein [Candidatus Eremiobacteraeota bacterium]|nr:MAG: Tetratricopeptide repeat protein [bacterium ADurb.Bin363]HPZ08090.1 tetratricopeptide repeat protein [Candidatus Eremiobacteraeota bacterium]